MEAKVLDGSHTKANDTKKSHSEGMMSARMIFLYLLHIYSLISFKKKHTVKDEEARLGRLGDQCIQRCDNSV